MTEAAGAGIIVGAGPGGGPHVTVFDGARAAGPDDTAGAITDVAMTLKVTDTGSA